MRWGALLLEALILELLLEVLILGVECVMRAEIQRPQFELRTETLNQLHSLIGPSFGFLR